LIDRDRKLIHGVTGQVLWDYGTGICTVDAPRAQGATGFLSRRPAIRLGDVTIESSSEYMTVLVVPLDGQPLKQSRRILVQVGTLARPTGWTEQETTFKGDDGKQTYQGKRVIDTGKMPWAIADASVKLTVANPLLRKATRLDANGMPDGEVRVTNDATSVHCAFPKDALYMVLEAR
jgi:hypothetical protein